MIGNLPIELSAVQITQVGWKTILMKDAYEALYCHLAQKNGPLMLLAPGGGFKYFFFSLPIPGEMIQFDGCICFKWVET